MFFFHYCLWSFLVYSVGSIAVLLVGRLVAYEAGLLRRSCLVWLGLCGNSWCVSKKGAMVLKGGKSGEGRDLVC